MQKDPTADRFQSTKKVCESVGVVPQVTNMLKEDLISLHQVKEILKV